MESIFITAIHMKFAASSLFVWRSSVMWKQQRC